MQLLHHLLLVQQRKLHHLFPHQQSQLEIFGPLIVKGIPHDYSIQASQSMGK